MIRISVAFLVSIFKQIVNNNFRQIEGPEGPEKDLKWLTDGHIFNTPFLKNGKHIWWIFLAFPILWLKVTNCIDHFERKTYENLEPKK